MSTSDDGLSLTRIQVRSARSGDRDALNDLLTRYLPWVRQTVALRLGRPLRACAELDDIVQESLLDAFRALDKFEERSEGSFRNWLACIVLNNVRDAGRRSNARRPAGGNLRPLAEPRDTAIAGVVPESRDPRPSVIARTNELNEFMEAAMLELSETHREVMILRDRCDMEYSDIAVQLGFRNADTARALYSRALSHVRTRLEQRGIS